MPKVFEIYQKAFQEGKEKEIPSSDIRILIANIQGYPEQIDVLLRKDDEFKNVDLFNEYFARLMNGEPVEYIINEATFFQRKLYVDHNVLIPRQETSELVAQITEKVTNYFDPRNYLVVADIGTGSGAITIALKDFFHNWLMISTDISEKSLGIAKKNFQNCNMSVQTMLGNSLEPLIENHIQLDILVSNPPYILNKDEVQDSVKNYEPETALYLDKSNSVYENIFRDYKKVKKEALWMCFEIGYDLKDYLIELMNKYLEDYEYEFVQDLNGLDRFLFVYCR